MVPASEELIHFIRKHPGRKTRALAAALGVGPEEFDAFAARLFDLQVEGEILRIPGEGWFEPQGTDFRVGLLRLTRRGDAFLELTKPERDGDIHLRSEALRDALDGDAVLVRFDRAPRHRKRDRGRAHLREGRVAEVVRRKKELVRGRFWAADPDLLPSRSFATRGPRRGRAAASEGGGSGEGAAEAKGRKAAPGFVKPLSSRPSKDIYVAPEDSLGARDGEKVLVRVLDEPSFGLHPRGRVVVRVDDEGSLPSDFEVIAAEFSFPVDHPEEALAEAEALPPIPGGSLPEPLLADREDLRGLLAFTIDPVDARDFDDAVSLEALPGGGLRLGVHIADVSHYARPGSALDRSAALRGTSIYLPGRTVPMLPERLSNDLASLRPGEDRLTKTVFLEFSSRGEPAGSRIFRSVIRNRRRFTYEEVLAILDEADRRRGGPPPGRSPYPRDRRPGRDAGSPPPPPPPDAGDYMEVLEEMAGLRDRLWRRRRERGALDLDIPRVRLLVGGSGEVLSIGRDERDPSRHLIEEFMLAANEAVARFSSEEGLPLISRVHPPPEEDRLEDFFYFLERSGLKLGRKGGSRDLQRIVEETAGEPLAPVIHLALLRSLAHAEYAPSPALHFALATATYCHFTSPIRRYPDLLVHQVLEEHLEGKLRSAGRRRFWDEEIPRHAADSSRAERRAEEAEREMTKLRLIRHLAPRLGEEMEGMVVSIHPFGFFVRAEPGFIEGLVHVATLADDFYEYDEDALCLRGSRRRRTFRLGDRVRVALSELDPDLRKIGFRLIERNDRG